MARAGVALCILWPGRNLDGLAGTGRQFHPRRPAKDLLERRVLLTTAGAHQPLHHRCSPIWHGARLLMSNQQVGDRSVPPFTRTARGQRPLTIRPGFTLTHGGLPSRELRASSESQGGSPPSIGYESAVTPDPPRRRAAAATSATTNTIP